MERNPLRRLAIIGAGPIGLEAALYGLSCGYDVRIFEKEHAGSTIGQWQHITFFSPFGINSTEPGRALAKACGAVLPDAGDCITGAEYLDTYLRPLAESPELSPRIASHSTVVAVSRRETLKSDYIGDARRKQYPFVLLIQNEHGEERVEEADLLIDASGTYGNPNWLGEGGIPAVGERNLQSAINYGPVNLQQDRQRFAGKTTLLAGSGHSAATVLAEFRSLFESHPQTRVIWLTRKTEGQPLKTIGNDPLPERAAVVNAAIASAANPGVDHRAGAQVLAIRRHQSGRFEIDIRQHGNRETLGVDSIIACTGFSPDNRLYRELQVHECYATRGPMKLAAALMGDSSADCLEQTGKGPEVLINPEPDFFIAGIKSYGRSPNFLLRIGHEQIRDIFRLISGNSELDLYRNPAVAGHATR